MDQIVQFIEPAKTFTKDSIRLVKRCTKPDRKGKPFVHATVYVYISKKKLDWLLVTTNNI